MARMKKLFQWLIESRRPLHLAAGLAIALATLYLCVFLNCSDAAVVTLTLWTTLIAALSAEYKDYDHGDKFDWLDILATIIPAIILSIIYIS